jgi:hypothetical protein
VILAALVLWPHKGAPASVWSMRLLVMALGT